MERGVVAQENSLKELQTLVKLMSQYLEKNGAGSDTGNAPSSPPSTAENAMNNIPVRSQSEKPAMPFNTRRPGK
jgi:hypothetical protein